VGDGSRTKFCLDICCGDCVQLSSPFRSLSCIARDKYALVADCIFSYNAEVHSEMNFIRLLHDWEVDFVFFFSVLYILLRVREMKISAVACWVPSKRRSFEVKFYKVLPNAEYFFPWKNIWRCKDPLRVTFFTWTTFLGRISHYRQSSQVSHHSDRLVLCVHKEWQNS
jgi:hypothetical protein